MKITRLDTPHCSVGEGPVWDVEEQALYSIDILGKCIHRHHLATGHNDRWEVPGIIGSMALRAGGGALIALKDGVHTYDFATGATAPLACPPDQDSRVQFNDGKTDRFGRFIVGSTDGTMKEPLGSIYSVGANGTYQVLDSGICISNGPCWSPDNRTFYFADSIPKDIYAYDYDPDTGQATNRRVFANTAAFGGIPDGATVDTDGLVYSAICEGGVIAVFRPDGAVERTIPMPVKLPGSVMFGGPNLDLLFVTTLDPAFMGRTDGGEGAGHTFVIEGLGARGLPEARYVD